LLSPAITNNGGMGYYVYCKIFGGNCPVSLPRTWEILALPVCQVIDLDSGEIFGINGLMIDNIVI